MSKASRALVRQLERVAAAATKVGAVLSTLRLTSTQEARLTALHRELEELVERRAELLDELVPPPAPTAGPCVWCSGTGALQTGVSCRACGGVPSPPATRTSPAAVSVDLEARTPSTLRSAR